MSTNPTPTKNIVDGTDEIIRDAINELTHGHEWFWTKTTMDEISNISPPESKFEALIDLLWEKIETNWRLAGERGGGDRNWRWAPQLYIDHEENESPETKLEKGLAGVLPKEHWTNQVPTASGLISSNSDRKRNIDLAHWDGAETVTLIELKIASDTPIYAAFEIIRNALLLCLSRVHPEQIKAVDPRWRRASRAHLRVVAPASFYEESGRCRSLAWFEIELDRAIATFGEKLPEHARISIDFGFRIFDLPEVLLNAIESARAFPA